MHQVKRALASAAVVAATAVLAMGCGSGGGDDSASSGSTTAGSGPKPTKSEIVLGMANASSGVADGAQTKSNEAVASAWTQWVNKDLGGINGHPVKVVVKDTKDDPATATRAAQTLIADKSVIAEVGGADTVSGAVWAKALNDAKVPMVGGELVDQAVVQASPYLFSLDIPTVPLVKLIPASAKAVGAKKVGVILCAESPACNGVADLLKPIVLQLGMKWGGFVGVRAGEASYTAACLAMKQSGADFVQLAVPSATGSRIIEDCQRQNITFPNYGTAYGGFDGNKLKPYTDKGVSVVGQFAGFPWFAQTPGAKQFRDVMAKYGGDAPYQNNIQTAAWAGFELFRKAMANASDHPTREEVAEALWKVKGEDLGLLPEPVTYTKGKTSPLLKCGWSATLSKSGYSALAKLCPGGTS